MQDAISDKCLISDKWRIYDSGNVGGSGSTMGVVDARVVWELPDVTRGAATPPVEGGQAAKAQKRRKHRKRTVRMHEGGAR